MLQEAHRVTLVLLALACDFVLTEKLGFTKVFPLLSIEKLTVLVVGC